MSESVSDARSDPGQSRPFHAVVEAETIQTTVELVDALFDECHLYLDRDGIRMCAIDPATVASVELTVDRTAFDAYEADGSRVGVDLGRFRDVVGMADRGQSVRLDLDATTRTLDIRIGGLEYSLALLDPETVRSPPDESLDELEFAGEVVTEGKDLDRAVTAADMVSSHLALGIDEADDEFYVEAEGDTDDVSLALSADEVVEFTPGEAHSLFSLDYLTAISRVLPDDREVDLHLGVEQPVALRYEFAKEAGSVEYLLAPRISSR